MTLTNRTILIIANELPLTTTLVTQLTKFNNKIVVLSLNPEIKNHITMMQPNVTILNLDIYDESNRMLLVEELNKRYLSPSYIIHNDFPLTEDIILRSDNSQFQTIVETYFTSLTHLNEYLIPFLETEADPTVAYILPNLSLLHQKHRKILFVYQKTIRLYVDVLNISYMNIRFMCVKYPLKFNLKRKQAMYAHYHSTKLDKFTTKFIRRLGNFTYLF